VSQARRDLVVAAVFCAVVGIYDLLYLWYTLTGGPLIGPPVFTPFLDFLVFHAAARAWLAGKQALIYDIDAFTAFQSALYADRLPGALGFRPFFYPPTWLLMLLPLGALAVGKAYAFFLSGTTALATALEGRQDWPGWLAVLVSPAAVLVAVTGQNTFFSLALFYGGLRLLDRAPATAGILLGLLAYKPQLWLLVPLALIAARRWRALAWMIGTVVVMALASLAVLGPDLWRAFFDAMREAGSAWVVEEMLTRVSTQIVSLFVAGHVLGLPRGGASALQMAGTVLAVAVVWVAFRRHPSSRARTALLATATFLVSPYTLNYDLLLLMPASVALFRQGAEEGFFPGEQLIHLVLWLMPIGSMVLALFGLPLVPLVILLFGAVAWRRRPAPKGELRPVTAAR
jgi:hypothetical protein